MWPWGHFFNQLIFFCNENRNNHRHYIFSFVIFSVSLFSLFTGIKAKRWPIRERPEEASGRHWFVNWKDGWTSKTANWSLQTGSWSNWGKWITFWKLSNLFVEAWVFNCKNSFDKAYFRPTFFQGLSLKFWGLPKESKCVEKTIIGTSSTASTSIS